LGLGSSSPEGGLELRVGSWRISINRVTETLSTLPAGHHNADVHPHATDVAYPFVDNVKPFSRFVKMFGTSAFVPGQGPLKATVAVWAMLRFILRTGSNRPGDLLSLDKEGPLSPVPAFRATLAALTGEEQARLTQDLRARGATARGYFW
jgi:hypothetical protein